MQVHPGLTEEPEEEPSDRLLLTDTEVAPVWGHTHLSQCMWDTHTPIPTHTNTDVPMLFRSSAHWLIWGKRRISFHFLLLPFRFPPSPVGGDKNQAVIKFFTFQSLFLPGVKRVGPGSRGLNEEVSHSVCVCTDTCVCTCMYVCEPKATSHMLEYCLNGIHCCST